MEFLQADGIDLTGADLKGVIGDGAKFDHGDLASAKLDGSSLRYVRFVEANLSGTSYRGADLKFAKFSDNEVEHSTIPGIRATQFARADFTGADLLEADLIGLSLRDAIWTGANFVRCRLRYCNLEDLDLPSADFTRADLRGTLLTGTTMAGARFGGADLRETGLADIDWENADLREADLRGSSFHLGSSRSGRVNSPIACEGSRTGFYTDDFDEQTFKAPEEIRKANLCGADLRGARIDDVDFYLVDLRGALLDRDQERHVVQCGAIRRSRV